MKQQRTPFAKDGKSAWGKGGWGLGTRHYESEDNIASCTDRAQSHGGPCTGKWYLR